MTRPSDNWRPQRYLPARPLQDLIARHRQVDAARDLRVSDRRIRLFMTQRWVRLDTADRWCMALGTHLEALYG